MEIKQEHIKKFRSLAKKLNTLMEEIYEYNPEAELYIEDSWNFNLMKGDTHDDKGKPMFGNIAAHETVFRSSGGGW